MIEEETYLKTDSVPSAPRETEPNNPNVTEQIEKLNLTEENAEEQKTSTEETTEPAPETETEDEKPKTKPKVKKPKTSVKTQSVNINVSYSHGFQIGNNYTIGATTPQQNPNVPSQDPLVKTPAVKALFKDESPVTKDQLHDISPLIGQGWMRLGRKLGLKQGMIEQIGENHKNNQEEVIYQMLLEWCQSNGSKATMRLLCEALEASGQFDAIRELVAE